MGRETTRIGLRLARAFTATVTLGTIVALGIPLAEAAPALPTPAQPYGSTESSSRIQTHSRAAAEDLPIKIDIKTLEPREVKTDSTVVISGDLTNTSSEYVHNLRLRLPRGEVIRTRGDLNQVAISPARAVSIGNCPITALNTDLAPGSTTPFYYECPASFLGMTQLGIYPTTLTVDASAELESPLRSSGRVSVLLPYFPFTITGGTAVAWIVPFTEKPHRLERDDDFLDDELGNSVKSDGRLGRLLTLAEQTPDNVQLTLAIDPELIDALHRMSDGEHPYTVKGSPGRHQSAAREWLSRLRTVVSKRPVVALPYADPDMAALSRIGLAAEFSRTTLDDRALLNAVLGVEPNTELAWPPTGSLPDQALDSIVSQGVKAVVLDGSALPSVNVNGLTPNAQGALPTLSGNAVALTTDPTLQSIVASAGQYSDGDRLAEQRFLVELAMMTAELPSATRQILVTPPRRWDPPASATAMINGSTNLSWLPSISALQMANAQPISDRGPLAYSKQAQRMELSSAHVVGIGKAQQRIADFRSAMDNKSAQTVLGSYSHALQRAASSAWQNNRAEGHEFVEDLNRTISDLRSKVHIISPTEGVYSLADPKSPLFLTVANKLSVPIRLRIQITSKATTGLEIEDPGLVVIDPGTRRRIQLDARVERSGSFVVKAQLLTPNGQALGARDGAPVELRVRSTAYGTIALAITGAAFAVLLLLVGRRLVARIRGHGESKNPTGGAEVTGPRSAT